MKEQAAWGTGETTGFFGIPVAGDATVDPNNNDTMSNRVRIGGQANQMKKGKYDWSGSIPSELDAAHIVFFLKQLLGDYTYTVDTPVAGANQHVIFDTSTQADLDQMRTKGFTTEIGGNGKFFTFDSCIAESLTLGEIEDGRVPAELGFRARERSAIASSTADAVTLNDVAQTFCSSQGVVSAGVDGAEVTLDVTVGGLTITQEGISPHHRQTPNTAKQWNQDGMLTVVGTFEIEVSDTENAAVITDFNNSDEASVLFTYTSDVLITGSTYYSITFDIPSCKYTSLGTRNDGILKFEKFEFTAGLSSNAALVTVTAINTETTF
jgi:hypothetical protein